MGDNLMRREQLRAYTANWSLKVKVLDFIKSGGPGPTRGYDVTVEQEI